MTRQLISCKAFDKDIKRMAKRGKDGEKLEKILTILEDGTAIPEKYKDHPLFGDWVGYRDLHIEPDWLLIYRIVGDNVELARTGTHADLFK